MTLERQGTRNRTLVGMERRTAQQGRDLQSQVDDINPATGTTFLGGTVLADIEITTTPQAFTHGLRSVDQSTTATARYTARAFKGAWIIKGNDGSFQLLVSSIGDDTKVVGLACDSGGPFTVTVAVV